MAEIGDTNADELSVQNKINPNKEKSLYRRIDQLDTQINTSAENGLFRSQNEVIIDKVKEQMLLTRKNLDTHQYSECETNLTVAIDLQARALYSTKRRWRFLHVYAGHIWIYLIAILVSIFAIYYFGLLDCPGENNSLTTQTIGSNNTSNSKIQGSTCALNKLFGSDVVGLYAVTWGCVGAVLRGLWYLKINVGRKQYRDAWIIYYLSVPFLGGILGAVVYFIIIGGLLTVTTNVDVKQSIPIIVFAALAGFNWEWAVRIFKALGDSLSPKSSQSESN